jgi:hypothetical protein
MYEKTVQRRVLFYNSVCVFYRSSYGIARSCLSHHPQAIAFPSTDQPSPFSIIIIADYLRQISLCIFTAVSRFEQLAHIQLPIFAVILGQSHAKLGKRFTQNVLAGHSTSVLHNGGMDFMKRISLTDISIIFRSIRNGSASRQIEDHGLRHGIEQPVPQQGGHIPGQALLVHKHVRLLLLLLFDRDGGRRSSQAMPPPRRLEALAFI